jgi:hypothetical protein
MLQLSLGQCRDDKGRTLRLYRRRPQKCDSKQAVDRFSAHHGYSLLWQQESNDVAFELELMPINLRQWIEIARNGSKDMTPGAGASLTR